MDLLQHLLLGGGSGGGGAVFVDPLSVVKNGVYTAPSGKAYSPVTVNVPQSGGGGVAAKDVNFLDYDGTIVAAYSAADFAALDALPDNPSHDGLTAQGWNWTLSDAQSYVASYGKLEIGQMYITDDGKTRLYIEITDILRNDVPIFFGQSVENGVTVDWGDGSAPETFAGTTNVSVSHVYAATGQYIITLDPADGCTLNLGSTALSSGNCVMGSTRNDFYVYANMLKKVEIGRSVIAIRHNAFHYCMSMRSITIPAAVASIGSSTFSSCSSLKSIVIPSAVTNMEAFYACYSLEKISIPAGITTANTGIFNNCYTLLMATITPAVTSIGNSDFNSCYSLPSVTIPSGVTSIAASAFAKCTGLASLKFTPSTPPTVASSTAFSNLRSDCKIYVPAGSLEAYTTATNYPNPSTYTYVEY